jgi:hypothetical protein
MIGENGTVSTPEQHQLPVYACAAGAVLHAHSSDTLEPAVLLYTFLPSGGSTRLDDIDAKIDVHGDGPGSDTLTLRVLSEGQSMSWRLPVAPFVAALPGQPGDDGRMVLLAVVDAEPEEGFWAKPIDCEVLAAELQIPVTDVADALRGRLTPWLADDVDLLLHDDAHEHATDLSPAQTLANAVLAHIRGDLEAEAHSTRLIRAFDYAPADFAAEVGARLCVALATAIVVAGPEGVEKALAQTGPFEPEVTRLLTDVPPRLRPDDPTADDPDATTDVLLASPDTNEAVRAAVTAVARLARTTFASDTAPDVLLRNLSMVDDAGQARLALLWVDLAVAAAGPASTDPVVVAELGERIEAEGAPAGAWLRATSAHLANTALELSGRQVGRLATPTQELNAFLARKPRTGSAIPAAEAALALQHCLTLARFVRTRASLGPGTWRQVPVAAAVSAVAIAMSRGLARESAVDLLDELLAEDVEAVDALEAFVCATAQLLVELDPSEPSELLADRVAELLARSPVGARSGRWLLVGCLREAPDHDAAATDLRPYLTGEPQLDIDRLAAKAGRPGVLRAGLETLEAVAGMVGEVGGLSRDELVALVLPAALMEHELLLDGSS